VVNRKAPFVRLLRGVNMRWGGSAANDQSLGTVCGGAYLAGERYLFIHLFFVKMRMI